jgi:SprB-like repeat protein
MKKNLFLLLSTICLALLSFNSYGLTVTLTSSNHNGYSVSCFGGRDGAITLSASGGNTPYTYNWSTGATTQNLSALPSGFYVVTVTDAVSGTRSANITLTEPTQLSVNLTPSVYNGVNNISCYNCCNGYINASISGGVTAYSYSWNSGQTTANLSNLCTATYDLTVTDANGCTVIQHSPMTQPDKDTWTMTGNTGSSASTNFMGTIDSVDFVLRTKNAERLRLKANGDIKFPFFAGSSESDLYVDSNGILKIDPLTVNCTAGGVIPGWSHDATNLFTKCPWINVGIGTVTPSEKLEVSHNDASGGIVINRKINGGPSWKSEIKFSYNGTPKWAIGNDLDGAHKQTFFIWDETGGGNCRLLINESGKVGINATPPVNSDIYKLYVGGGIKTHDVLVTATDPLPDYVFNADYKLMSIYELEQFIKQNHHLPEIPSAEEIEKNEGFEVGDMQVKLLKKIEEQSLYIIDLQKQVDELKKEMKKQK